MHLVCFESPIQSNPEAEQELDEFSKGSQSITLVILIMAVGIKDVSIYTLNLNTMALDFHIDSQLSFPQGATFLDYSGIVKHSRNQYSLLIGQQAHMEAFRITLEFEAKAAANASGLVGSGEELPQNLVKPVKNKDLRTMTSGFAYYANNATKSSDSPMFGPSGYLLNNRRSVNDKKRFLPANALEPDSPYLRFRSPSRKIYDLKKTLTEYPESPLIKSLEETPEHSLKGVREHTIARENVVQKGLRNLDSPLLEKSPRVSIGREKRPSRFSQKRLMETPPSEHKESNQKSERGLKPNPDTQCQLMNSNRMVHINQAISEFSQESQNESSLSASKNSDSSHDSDEDLPALDGKVHKLPRIHTMHRGFRMSSKDLSQFQSPSQLNGRVAEAIHHPEEFTLRRDSFKIKPQLAVEPGRSGSDLNSNLILPETKQVSRLQGRRRHTFEGCLEIVLEGIANPMTDGTTSQKNTLVSKFSFDKKLVSNSDISNLDQAQCKLEVPNKNETNLKQNVNSEDQSTRQIPPATTDLQVPPRSPVTSSLSGADRPQTMIGQTGEHAPHFDRQPSSISGSSSDT
jgi:hypothetical protein